jgi:hypothetical protein
MFRRPRHWTLYCAILIHSTTSHPVWIVILSSHLHIGGCIQKFPEWLPGARTAKGAALCHWVQLYHYFVSQSSEFCRHNPLCCFSTSVYCCGLVRYRLSPETFGYTLVYLGSGLLPSGLQAKILYTFPRSYILKCDS